MPNIATWWCGQPRERERVLDEFDPISIAPAFGAELAGAEGTVERHRRGTARERTRAPARRDRRARTRLRRTGGRAPVDDAALGRKTGSSRGRSSCASIAPRPRTAGGSCPADSAGSPIVPTRAPSRWATASSPPTSGCSPKIRSRVSSLLPIAGQRPNHPAARQSAEPRRGQSVLVRPLSRAGRSDAAGRALPQRAIGRSGRADAPRPAVAGAADGRARRLGRGRCGDAGGRRDRGEQPGPARPGPLRVGAVARALGAKRGFGHPRAPHAIRPGS